MEHTIDNIEKVSKQELCNEYEHSIYVIVFKVENSKFAKDGISIVKATNETEAENIFKHDTQLGSIIKSIRVKYIKKLPITITSNLLYEYIN